MLDDHQWADSASVELLDAPLSEDARLVLEGAAVAGDPFEPELDVMYAQHRDDRRADRLGELVGLPPHGRPGRIASRATG